MKIWLYAYPPLLGGVLRHVETLALELKTLGEDPLLWLHPSTDLDSWAASLRERGVTVSRGVAQSSRDLSALYRLRERVRRERPDIVHFHKGGRYESLLPLWIVSREKAATVVTEHLPFFPSEEGPFRLRWLLRRVQPSASRLLLLGPSWVGPYRELVDYPEERIRLVPPFVGRVPPLPKGERGNRLGFLGEFTSRKGVDRLIEALPLFVAEGYTLTFCGRGALEEELKREGRRYPGRVFVEPFREDVAEFYRKIDLLLLPSLWEGLPLVLLEALSAGIPGAVTPVGVIPDYFRDGEGVYYIGETTPQGLLETVSRALSGGEVPASLWEENFSPRRVVERVRSVYREIAHGE